MMVWTDRIRKAICDSAILRVKNLILEQPYAILLTIITERRLIDKLLGMFYNLKVQ